jgi:hypothetical protein
MTSQSQTAGARTEQSPLFYLWHLERIGLLEEPKFGASTFWQESLPEVRVAIIDSGCTTKHPNLPPGAIHGALDVAVDPNGAVFRKEDLDAAELAWRTRSEETEQRLEHILSTIRDKKVRSRIDKLLKAMSKRRPRHIDDDDAPNPADFLSGHGTACAGLIGGRKLKKVASDAPTASDAVLPYFGVNPYATIIPITTPYSHDIAPLITALLHAVLCGADVILLPRTVNDLSKVVPPGLPPSADLRATRFDEDDKLRDAKLCFEHLLAAIAQDRPVVLASGNEGAGNPGYPASIARAKRAPNGADSLIVVGAANHLGLRSSYSNGTYETGVTTYAPSDDEEMANTHAVRRDSTGELGPELRRAVNAGETDSGVDFSPFGVLALDVPGRLAGGEELIDDVAALPRRLLYCRFGGTSAASALVAGLISLTLAVRRQKGLERLTGQDACKLLSKRPREDPPLAAGVIYESLNKQVEGPVVSPDKKDVFIQVGDLVP